MPTKAMLEHKLMKMEQQLQDEKTARAEAERRFQEADEARQEADSAKENAQQELQWAKDDLDGALTSGRALESENVFLRGFIEKMIPVGQQIVINNPINAVIGTPGNIAAE